MSNEYDSYRLGHGRSSGEDPKLDSSDNGEEDPQRRRYRDEVYSKRVPAGKRTYFFDVKTTRSGEDFFVTITESKRLDEERYEKQKIFLYKEDFGKFITAIHEVIDYIKTECLPDYEFREPTLPVEAETDRIDS